jgi:hypothetical protein
MRGLGTTLTCRHMSWAIDRSLQVGAESTSARSVLEQSYGVALCRPKLTTGAAVALSLEHEGDRRRTRDIDGARARRRSMARP